MGFGHVEDGFDPTLHIWGRPYFVTVEGTGPIAEMIDRYLAARTDREIDAIARENLAALDPSLPRRAKPSREGRLPGDKELAESIRSAPDILRAAFEASKKGQSVTLPAGNEVDGRKLLAREVAFQALVFSAAARPGWMDRGTVWPTWLFAKVGVQTGRLFTPPRALLGALGRRKVPWFLEHGITENYMVGGYVKPANVARLCALLEKHRGELEACYSEGGAPSKEMRTSVKKLVEAASDARLRGLAFVEATEVYSGFAGVMN